MEKEFAYGHIIISLNNWVTQSDGKKNTDEEEIHCTQKIILLLMTEYLTKY